MSNENKKYSLTEQETFDLKIADIMIAVAERDVASRSQIKESIVGSVLRRCGIDLKELLEKKNQIAFSEDLKSFEIKAPKEESKIIVPGK